jgi:hypothetical protein
MMVIHVVLRFELLEASGPLGSLGGLISNTSEMDADINGWE